ncbi:YjjG family noncanonical pyrimidine nucleotidase [Rhizobium sp. ZPR3]|uniref:YjjG family noncanonical pyrimidine nucleotidase n=2 Tax=unclassified Rhizobium TaxID=2613769 RepID=A0AAU7SRX2_9HYPH
MKYRYFLFDLDDTLLDFKASERLSFFRTMASVGVSGDFDAAFRAYQAENTKLWLQFEKGFITKDFLKVERFRLALATANIDADPNVVSSRYLDMLPEAVVLLDGAREICEHLSAWGEVGIITNGIEHVQTKRIANSGLSPWLSFVATSEACGFAKPDARFFEYSTQRFTTFNKAEAIIIGDRLDADILGGNQFGIESCWFNPMGIENNTSARPTMEVASLSEIPARLSC